MRLAFVIGFTTFTAVSSAQVSYVSQVRSVGANAGGGGETQSASDFGVFNGDVSDSASHPWGGASGYARQNSTLGASAIIANAVVGGSGNSRNWGGGRTLIDVTFDLLSESHLELSGTMGIVPDYMSGGATFIQLERVGGPVLARFDGDIQFGDPWEVDFSGANAYRGTVNAGRYRLIAQLITSTDMSQQADFNFVLSGVPTPGSLAVLGLGALATRRRRR